MNRWWHMIEVQCSSDFNRLSWGPHNAAWFTAVFPLWSRTVLISAEFAGGCTSLSDEWLQVYVRWTAVESLSRPFAWPLAVAILLSKRLRMNHYALLIFYSPGTKIYYLKCLLVWRFEIRNEYHSKLVQWRVFLLLYDHLWFIMIFLEHAVYLYRLSWNATLSNAHLG